MAIPDRPLNLRGTELSFDETDVLLSLGEGGRIDRAMLRRWRQLLAAHSDWTDEEIGQITWQEVPVVFGMVERARQDDSVRPTSASS